MAKLPHKGRAFQEPVRRHRPPVIHGAAVERNIGRRLVRLDMGFHRLWVPVKLRLNYRPLSDEKIHETLRAYADGRSGPSLCMLRQLFPDADPVVWCQDKFMELLRALQRFNNASDEDIRSYLGMLVQLRERGVGVPQLIVHLPGLYEAYRLQQEFDALSASVDHERVLEYIYRYGHVLSLSAVQKEQLHVTFWRGLSEPNLFDELTLAVGRCQVHFPQEAWLLLSLLRYEAGVQLYRFEALDSACTALCALDGDVVEGVKNLLAHERVKLTIDEWFHLIKKIIMKIEGVNQLGTTDDLMALFEIGLFPLNSQGSGGSTILHHICRPGEYDPWIVAYMLEVVLKGAEDRSTIAGLRDDDGQTISDLLRVDNIYRLVARSCTDPEVNTWITENCETGVVTVTTPAVASVMQLPAPESSAGVSLPVSRS